MRYRALIRGTVVGAVIGSAIGAFATTAQAFGQTAPGGGSAVLSYSVTVQAPILQVTQDDPTATFHPQGEGDLGYSFASLDPAGEHALSSLVWPGSAAGNAGTLLEVLGVASGQSELNDPVRAEAISGSAQTKQSTTTPAGTEMSATVEPPTPSDQYAAANSVLAAQTLATVASVGASTSNSTIHFESSTGQLTAIGRSSASAINIDGGLISIGSVTSVAQATSSQGGQPQLSGSTVVHNMTVAGQSAYVDGSGVHVGQPGNPAPPPVQDAVNSALQQAGMQIYSTAPAQVTIGQVNYYNASSLLFYWAPPGDSNHDSFTASLGGAGISMAATSAAFQGALANLSGGTDTGTTAITPTASTAADTGTAAPPQLSLPVGATPTVASQPQVAPPARNQPTVDLASTRLPGGLGAGWFVLIALAAILGALGLTRVPALLASAGAAGPGGCPNQNRLRNEGRGRSS